MASLRRSALFWAAVLLALALGLALGGGLLARVGGGAQRTTEDLRGQVNSLQQTQTSLEAQIKAGEDFVSLTAGRLLADSMTDQPVVIVTTPSANRDDVDAVTEYLRRSGGKVASRLALTAAVAADSDAERLRGIVDRTIPAGARLNTAFVDPGSRLGDLLSLLLLVKDAGGATPTAGDRSTALAALRSGGFVNFSGTDLTPGAAALVVTGGEVAAGDGAQGQAYGRLASALGSRGSGVALVGRTGSAAGSGPLAVVRGDPGLAKTVATVDNVDTAIGQVTTVLALSVATSGRPAAYGVGPGASAVSPGTRYSTQPQRSRRTG